MTRPARGFVTMYMHTLDGQPARLIQYKSGPVMLRVTRKSHVPLVHSLKAIRVDQLACCQEAVREQAEFRPHLPRQANEDVGRRLYARMGYRLVAVPVLSTCARPLPAMRGQP